MEWKLLRHGDGPERSTAKRILRDFPHYEVLWAKYIVPLTFRPSAEHLFLVRSGPNEDLLRFASAHYGVYARLAMALSHLERKDGLTKVQSFYEFYFSLHGALQDGVQYLLRASKDLLTRYRFAVPEELKERSAKWRDSACPADYSRLVDETATYRNLGSHASILVMVNGKVPSRALLPARGARTPTNYIILSELAKLQLSPERVDREYVDARDLGERHFTEALHISDRIWKGLGLDLARLDGNPEFAKDVTSMSPEDHEYLRRFIPGPTPGLIGPQGPMLPPHIGGASSSSIR